MNSFFLRLLSVLFLVLFTSSSWAVPENDYDRVYDLLRNQQDTFYRHYSFIGLKNLKIVFTKFGTVKGPRGSLVISPGRTESSLKYVETAYDFMQAGYSPIYVINHRGQGLSQRQLPDTQKGYVGDYSEYSNDFAQFMHFVLADKNVDKNNLFAITHSMGGAIVTDYLMYVPSPFKAVALSAPLYKIPSDKTEQQLLQETFFACYVQFACKDYVPGGGPFKWEDRHFETNDVTHSFVRFSYRDYLWRQWPALQLGSPTIRWARETIQANIRRRDIAKLGHIASPFLILQAEEELVVDNSGHAPVCSRMGNKCRIEKVRGSRHEMLMEKDAIRNAVIQRMLSFFESHR